ncbi:hypothetical protein [Mucilaginibacter hurinus]|nr:hypothetical protein [Mucilaginibacter hurinus]
MISDEILTCLQRVDDNRLLIATKKPEGLKILRAAYYKVYGEHYQEGCGPCHEKAFYKLMKILNNPKSFTPMAEKKYVLKKGYQVSLFGSGEIYTNNNLTDKRAAALLRERPQLAKNFVTINGKPADEWQIKTAAKKIPKATEVTGLIEKAHTQAEFKAVVAVGNDSKTGAGATGKEREKLTKTE